MASNRGLLPAQEENDNSLASEDTMNKSPSAVRREENAVPSTTDKARKDTGGDDTIQPQAQQSQLQDRRLSREWDASKVPPSQFQRPKGSIYATPNTRDGHVAGPDRDQKYWDKMKEKGWLPGSDKK